MSKETREMVDNILKSLDVKYRSGEWYRVDDVRKLLHELVDGYNTSHTMAVKERTDVEERLKAIVNDITDDPILQHQLFFGKSLKELRGTLEPITRTVEDEEE